MTIRSLLLWDFVKLMALFTNSGIHSHIIQMVYFGIDC
jgi:hypothetical protein